MELEDYLVAHPERSLLEVKGRCVYNNEKLYEHAKAAISSGFPELRKAQWPPYALPIMIIGSGTSAKKELPKIRHLWQQGFPVMAVKGAHDWLMSNGIIPQYAVAADPKPERATIFKWLNDNTIYLCASQCHPDMWEYMRGYKVIIWHSETNLLHRNLDDFKDTPLVPGGSTTGLRALVLAYLLGFRKLELFGFDSCVAEDGEYKIGSEDRDNEVDVFIGEKKYRAALSMVPQVQDLMPTLQLIPGVKVNAHGEGYFQEVLRQGKAQGWPV